MSIKTVISRLAVLIRVVSVLVGATFLLVGLSLERPYFLNSIFLTVAAVGVGFSLAWLLDGFAKED